MTVRGTWEFDSAESRVTLHGAMVVADGFNHLNNDWRTPTTGLVSLSVEERWFHRDRKQYIPRTLFRQVHSWSNLPM